jgi:hypothetical protein
VATALPQEPLMWRCFGYHPAVTEHGEVLVKLALTVAAIVVLLWRHRGQAERGKAGVALGLLALLSVGAYCNFFTFHEGRFTHFGENFHYQLGSKYFPELGYDGLYEASVAAQAESAPGLPLPRVVRDLRTNTIEPVRSVDEHREAVLRRFTPDRWRSFVADHATFVRPEYLAKLNKLRLDHGYNPTPTWTFVGRLFNRWIPLNDTTIPLLALMDWLLLAVMFFVVYKTYGSAVGATALILFGAGYPWRYAWVGGAFLRYDWLAAVVIGCCLLKRRRFTAAGALVAYAASVRLFPALLLVGIVAVAGRDLVRRSTLLWARRFGVGLLVSSAVCFLAGAAAGRGVAAWSEFAHNIKKHHETWSTNTAGLELVFLTTPQTMVSRIPASWPLAERWATWQAAMNQAQKERRPFYMAVALLLVAGAVVSAAMRTPDEGLAIGVAAVFAGLVLSCYYWVVLILLALRRGTGNAVGMLGVNLAALVTALFTSNTQIIFGVFSWGLLALFVVLFAPDVARVIRSGLPPLAANGESRIVPGGRARQGARGHKKAEWLSRGACDSAPARAGAPTMLPGTARIV